MGLRPAAMSLAATDWLRSVAFGAGVVAGGTLDGLDAKGAGLGCAEAA